MLDDSTTHLYEYARHYPKTGLSTWTNIHPIYLILNGHTNAQNRYSRCDRGCICFYVSPPIGRHRIRIYYLIPSFLRISFGIAFL